MTIAAERLQLHADELCLSAHLSRWHPRGCAAGRRRASEGFYTMPLSANVRASAAAWAVCARSSGH